MINNINQIIDNYSSDFSIKELDGLLPSAKILVNCGSLKNETGANLSEYFDIVISTSMAAHRDLGFSDLIFWKSESAYQDGIFTFDALREAPDSIVLLNLAAAAQLKKLNKKLMIAALTYSPVLSGVTDGRSVQGNSLLKGQEELHVASILLGSIYSGGEIFSDGGGVGVRGIDTNGLSTYVNEQETIRSGPVSIGRPKNRLKVSRLPLRQRF